MFFVEAHYHRDAAKVPQQIRYISHREERLPSGERRELFGIGDRYKALRGDEKAIERAFAEDSKGLRRPVYFRFILTVDNRTDPAAGRSVRIHAGEQDGLIRSAHRIGERDRSPADLVGVGRRLHLAQRSLALCETRAKLCVGHFGPDATTPPAAS